MNDHDNDRHLLERKFSVCKISECRCCQLAKGFVLSLTGLQINHQSATCNLRRDSEINLNVAVCKTCFPGSIEALIHIFRTVSCYIRTFSVKKRTIGLDPYLLLLDRVAFSDPFFHRS